MRKGIREMTDQELIAAREAGEITASASLVEQERRAAAASPPPVVEGWTLDRVMLKPGAALEELLYYKRRVQELLETTNRYLERARLAEAPAEARHGGETFSRAQMLAEVDRRVERALAARSALPMPEEKPAAEPTDAMIEAGEEEIASRKAHGCRIFAADIWTAMARAASSEDE